MAINSEAFALIFAHRARSLSSLNSREMVAHVPIVVSAGTEILDVETQMTIQGGLPVFSLVGLPDRAIVESKERVPRP